MQIRLQININRFGKFNLLYVVTFLFIVFCNLWIYKSVPIPLYYFYIIGLFFIPFFLLHKKCIKLTKVQILALISSLYVLSVFIYGQNDWQYVIHHASAISYFVIATIFLFALKKKQVLNITNFLISFNLVLITLETYWRLSHPMFRTPNTPSAEIMNSFYIYKTNSFMISDANSIALMTVLLCILSLYMYIRINKINFYKISCIWFAILTVLTLSRSAIISLFFSFFIFYILHLRKDIKNLYSNYKLTIRLCLSLIILFIAIPLILHFLYNKLILDVSLQTKLSLFNDTYVCLIQLPLSKIVFGVGTSLEQANKYLNRFPHNIISTYLLWHGFLGLVLIYYLWYLIYKQTNKYAGLVLLPWFLAGISFVQVGLHIFYVVLAIIYYFEKRYNSNVFELDNSVINYEKKENAYEKNNLYG